MILMSGKQKTVPKHTHDAETPLHDKILSFITRSQDDKTRLQRLLLLVIILVASAVALSLSLLLRSSGREKQQFSGERAFSHVKAIVDFGPRPSGSEALKNAGEYIKKELVKSGLEARDDRFSSLTPIGNVAMNNIVGVLKGNHDDVLIVGTHYESKYFPTQRFVGANDGGSGTGVLLEAARVLSGRKDRALTIWFVFFDGEEAFGEWSDTDGLYGSKRFARDLNEKGMVSKVKALLLLDMVGDRDLQINNDAYSTPWLRETMQNAAGELGFEQYFNGPYAPIQDDHLPFLEISIPSIDIIDMNYPFWHSPDDSLDKVSPGSLEIVGLTLLQMVGRLEERLVRQRYLNDSGRGSICAISCTKRASTSLSALLSH